MTERTTEEILRLGTKALLETLGPGDMLRYFAASSYGKGDSVEAKWIRNSKLTPDEIKQRIEEYRRSQGVMAASNISEPVAAAG